MSTYSPTRPLPLDPAAALVALRVQELLDEAEAARAAGPIRWARLPRRTGTALARWGGIRRTAKRPALACPSPQPCGC